MSDNAWLELTERAQFRTWDTDGGQIHQVCNDLGESIQLKPDDALAFASQLPEVKALVKIARVFYEKNRHISEDPKWSLTGEEIEKMGVVLALFSEAK